MFYVYILVSEKKGVRFYVGMTEDVEERLKEHNSGKTKSTKGYLPWKLFKTESFQTRIEARKKEKYLKTGSAKERIRENWQKSQNY
jgi:putative endonuclease